MKVVLYARVSTKDAPRSLAVADLDGDQDLDLVIGDRSGGVTVAKNDGNAAFDTNRRNNGQDADRVVAGIREDEIHVAISVDVRSRQRRRAIKQHHRLFEAECRVAVVLDNL